MSGSSFGQLFVVTTAGESHGPAMLAIVDGCPPNFSLCEADLQCEVDRRKTGQSRCAVRAFLLRTGGGMLIRSDCGLGGWRVRLDRAREVRLRVVARRDASDLAITRIAVGDRSVAAGPNSESPRPTYKEEEACAGKR